MHPEIRFNKHFSNTLSKLIDAPKSPTRDQLLKDTMVLRNLFKRDVPVLDNFAKRQPLARVLPDRLRLAASKASNDRAIFRDQVAEQVNDERAINAALRLFQPLVDDRPLSANPTIASRDPDSRLLVWRHGAAHVIGFYLHPLARPALTLWWAGGNAGHEAEIERMLGLSANDNGWKAISGHYATFLERS